MIQSSIAAFAHARHRHGAYAGALSGEIHNYPAALPLLNVAERQLRGFLPPQTAADEHGEQRGVTPPLSVFVSGAESSASA